jgi:anaerobic C4-dicarboxylate transporter
MRDLGEFAMGKLWYAAWLGLLGLVLAAILMSCSNGSVVTDYKYVTVQQLIEVDGVLVSQALECDELVSGRIVLDLDDSTLVASVSHQPKEFKIIGNFPEDSTVLILEDTETNQYLFHQSTLDSGEKIVGIQFGDRVIVFCDKRHQCHDAAN